MANILVVDDEVDIARMIESLLVDEGHTVAVAFNGEEAFKYLEENSTQLILSDIRMPQMNGVQLLGKVKDKFGNTPPVIFLTSYAEVNEEDAHTKGASAYIHKPFDLEELLEVVDTVLEANQTLV